MSNRLDRENREAPEQKKKKKWWYGLRAVSKKGEELPRFYGLAYWDVIKDETVCCPIPLNWIVWLIRETWIRICITPPSKKDGWAKEWWQKGWDEGRRQGKREGIHHEATRVNKWLLDQKEPKLGSWLAQQFRKRGPESRAETKFRVKETKNRNAKRRQDEATRA